MMLFAPPPWATALHAALIAYAAIGLALGLAFLFRGIDRVTPDAKGSLAFRPLLLPGLILLWPLIAWRWRKATRA